MTVVVSVIVTSCWGRAKAREANATNNAKEVVSILYIESRVYGLSSVKLVKKE